MPSKGEIRTAQFYTWDLLGSGKLIYPKPVELEPPFIPFEVYAETGVEEEFVDDLRKPGLLARIGKFFDQAAKSEIPLEEYCQELPEPYYQDDEGPYETFRFALERSDRIVYDETLAALGALIVSRAPISFEFFGNSEKITVQLATSAFDADRAQVLLGAYIGVPLIPVKDEISEFRLENSALFEFCLEEEFVRPIATLNGKGIDPLKEAMAILEALNNTELGLVQVLFQGVLNPWAPTAKIAVGDGAGGSFFIDEPNAPRLAEEKFGHSLFAASIRCVAFAGSEGRRKHIGASLSQALLNASASENNRLELGTFYETAPPQLQRDIRERRSHRLGMLLSAAELGTFVHLPFGITSDALYGKFRKTHPAPLSVQGHAFVVGINEHNGVETEVSLSTEDRLRHTHIIGATGTGKSTFLEHCIIQDIEAGHGVIVLDPHGDLIDSVLGRIPRERVADVVLINPSELEHAVGFNVLDAKSEYERIVLSSDLVALFRRYASSWGDQMTSVLANAVDAVLERGGTLVDLQHFLSRPKFRDEWIEGIKALRTKHYWTHDFKGLRKNSIAPLLTRLDLFLRPNIIRAMVGQKTGLSLHDVLGKRQVLLVRLAHGLIGAENSYLLGSLFVSKIHQAALSRQSLSQYERHPTFLYLDEFQHFLTPSLASILSEARKYGLGLIMAHQGMYQLQGTGIDESIIANIGSRIAFQVGETDARKLEAAYAHFDRSDLLTLSVGEAVARVGRADQDFSLTTPPPKRNDSGAKTLRLSILEASNARFAKLSSSVLAELDKEYLITDEKFQELRTSQAPTKSLQSEESMPKEVKPELETPKLELPNPSKKTVEQIREADAKRSYDKQHQYLQSGIKKIAEARGFSVSVEEATNDRKGRIDLVLRRSDIVIAVELARTTTDEHELNNIVKCVKSGYSTVYLVVENRSRIEKMKQRVKKEPALAKSQVKIFAVDALAGTLDALSHTSGKIFDKKYKGYRVRSTVRHTDKNETSQNVKDLARIVGRAIKRSNPNSPDVKE